MACRQRTLDVPEAEFIAFQPYFSNLLDNAFPSKPRARSQELSGYGRNSD
ncbi:MAG: hypothetical protein NTY23_12165 [Chloroflexi bacterium]|nr:hypothetical protein [Chloroflexota bacterium]